MPRNVNYKGDLLEDLQNDPGFAAAYLSAAIADSREAFLIALRDVAEAKQGMSQLANRARVNRESLYRALSEDGNPRFSTLESVLDALGMGLSIKLKITPKRTPKGRQRAPRRRAGRIQKSML